MHEFFVRGTEAEKKGVENLCLPINIIDDRVNFFGGNPKAFKDTPKT
jgi:hypothetical protein